MSSQYPLDTGYPAAKLAGDPLGEPSLSEHAANWTQALPSALHTQLVLK